MQAWKPRSVGWPDAVQTRNLNLILILILILNKKSMWPVWIPWLRKTATEPAMRGLGLRRQSPSRCCSSPRQATSRRQRQMERYSIEEVGLVLAVRQGLCCRMTLPFFPVLRAGSVAGPAKIIWIFWRECRC